MCCQLSVTGHGLLVFNIVSLSSSLIYVNINAGLKEEENCHFHHVLREDHPTLQWTVYVQQLVLCLHHPLLGIVVVRTGRIPG